MHLRLQLKICSRSLLSKLVGENEVGKIFSAVAMATAFDQERTRTTYM